MRLMRGSRRRWLKVYSSTIILLFIEWSKMKTGIKGPMIIHFLPMKAWLMVIREFSSILHLMIRKASDFIAAMGYCKGIFPSFYHEPILTSDSLLGVRYLMTTKEYYGTEYIEDIQAHNDKSVYRNPYALNLGFAVNENVLEELAAGDQFDVNTIQAR